MSEAIPHTEFMKEVVRRVEMEQLIGYEICKGLGLDQASYILNNPVQGELWNE